MNYQYSNNHSNNHSNNPIIGGNTEGTPISLLRKDLDINNDIESNYSIDSIKTSTDIRQLVDEINSDIKGKGKNKTKSKGAGQNQPKPYNENKILNKLNIKNKNIDTDTLSLV
jgi:hypothetical protein